MKKFDFPFQRIMEWRDRVAEQERTNLETLHAARLRLEREREAVVEHVGHSHAAVASAAVTAAEDLRHLAAFVDAMRVKEQEIKHRAVQCQAHITAQTERCIEADRDHELLVRLRDRQMSAWQMELDRETEQGAAESWMSGRARALARNGLADIP